MICAAMWLAVFTALSNSTVRRKNEGSQGAETPETGGGNSGNRAGPTGGNSGNRWGNRQTVQLEPASN